MNCAKFEYNVVVISDHPIGNDSMNSIDTLIKRLNNEIEHKNSLCIIKYSFINSSNRINYCLGCKKCFRLGQCPLDEIDDMKKLKVNLQAANLIILATPIYEKNVSGFIKTLLDRLGYWQHLMFLAGKGCVIVVSGKHLGHEFVCQYLYEVCSNLGMTVIGKVCKNLSININKLEFEIDLVTNNISMIANKIYDIGSNTLLENIFSNYQYIYSHLYNEKQPKTLEQKYWSNLKDIETFQELIKLRKDV